MTELNPRQARFVDEFLVDLSATAAARRAGYSKKTAGSQGHDLLKKPEIQSAIELAQAERAKQTGINAEWVVKQLVDIVDRSMQAVPVLDSEGRETGKWTYQGNTAIRALELLAKHTGGFSDKSEVEHTGNIKVTIKLFRDDDEPLPSMLQ
jgi:phage terminase small subunit